LAAFAALTALTARFSGVSLRPQSLPQASVVLFFTEALRMASVVKPVRAKL
jgi:hypothetical protein